MLNGVWEGLARQHWAAPELQKIEVDLAKLDWLSDYVFCMGCDRGAANDLFDATIRNPRALARTGGLGQSAASGFAYHIYPVGWLYLSKVRANRYMDEVTARFEPAQRRVFLDRPVPSSPRDLISIPERIQFMMFFMWSTVFESVETKFLQTAVMTDEARIACALERYFLARGAYPAQLAELAPDFTAELPAEIMNGQAYHYRRTEEGRCLLYSVGMDLQDDGGEFDPKLKPNKQKDWIWSYGAPVTPPAEASRRLEIIK
jgi:hypothetical protein